MKVRLLIIFLMAALTAMIISAGPVAAEDERIAMGGTSGSEEAWDWDEYCPLGSTAVIGPDGNPVMKEECMVEAADDYSGDEVLVGIPSLLPDSGDGGEAEPRLTIEDCIVCQQNEQELVQTVTEQTVQQDAYPETAAGTTRSTMPSTGVFLLPAAGLLALGAGILGHRRRS